MNAASRKAQKPTGTRNDMPGICIVLVSAGWFIYMGLNDNHAGMLAAFSLGLLGFWGVATERTAGEEKLEETRAKWMKARGLCVDCGAKWSTLETCGWKNCENNLPFDAQAPNSYENQLRAIGIDP